jgi:NAD(P)H-hydrate epimerase
MSPHLPLVTAEEIAAIDAATVAAGTLGRDLMQRAGRGVWEQAAERYDIRPDTRAVFLCGKGNNGGDGFVAARSARSDGLDPVIILFADEQDVTGDALYHLREARKTGVAIRLFSEFDEHALTETLRSADLVFDALLGTGLAGPPRSPIDRAIDVLSQHAGRTIAVDVPSGMNADTGEGQAAAADLTVAFGCAKPGHVFYPGKSRCGDVAIVDIGLSEAAVAARSTRHISFGIADPHLPERSRTAHKGDAGKVAIIAGSVGLTGAACLASQAALRSGSGLVTLGLPETLNDIAEVKLTEVMTRPLPEVRKHRCLALRARGDIQSLFGGVHAIALGPGLGRHRETAELVRRLILDLTAPAVLDADGLNAFAGDVDRLSRAAQPLVLTPHPGEYRRLTGSGPDALATPNDVLEAAETLASRTGAVVVLKGAPTVIALPDGTSFVNLSGNPGMATGGTGDVLTGVIASLMGQGLSPEDAAISGVYWHGLAADLSADRVGERGLLACDIIDTLPEAERLIGTGNSRSRYMDYQPLSDGMSPHGTDRDG